MPVKSWVNFNSAAVDSAKFAQRRKDQEQPQRPW